MVRLDYIDSIRSIYLFCWLGHPKMSFYQAWAGYLEGDNISTKIGSGRDQDRGGLPDFSRNRDRGGLSKKSGRGHRDFIREESRQVGIIREVGGKRDYLDFPRKSRVIPTLP